MIQQKRYSSKLGNCKKTNSQVVLHKIRKTVLNAITALKFF